MATKHPPAPRASEIALSDTIVVKVGAAAKRYTLHKRLLIHHSKYFGGALSGGFRESQDGIVALEDVATEVFDIFVDWMYEKTLPDDIDETPRGKGITKLHLHAYVLADRLMVSAFKRVLFDVMFDRLSNKRKYLFYEAITFSFDNLPDKDPFLQLCIDAFCINDAVQRYSKNLEESLPEVPQRALVRLLQKMHMISNLTKEEKKLDRDDYDI